MKRLALLTGLLLLSGCTMIPNYERPSAPVGKTWPGETEVKKNPQTKSPAKPLPKENFVKDAKLRELIQLALANNRDLRVATLNVEQARAKYRIQRGELFPSIGGTAAGDFQRIAKTLSTSGEQMDTEAYQLGVGFTSYELDLFGRIRSLKSKALEQYFALQETRESVRLSLVAEIGSAYLKLLADRSLLKLTENTLESQRDSYEMIRKSFEYGVGTELDVKQAETSVRSAETNLAQYKRAVAQDKNALALLLGCELPKDLEKNIARVSDLEVQTLLTELPAGLPSDLLERRPDIRAAEHELKAANANIGAARAAFFPTITLTSSIGTASNELSGLFVDGSGVWQFAPQIRLPIFEGGTNVANYDAAKIAKRIEIAKYEKAIQTAFREVADCLEARKTLQEQLKAQQLLVEASEKSYYLYEMKYRNGIENYLNVLIWQRSFYSAQQSLIQTRLAYLNNLVTLYKALGGEWNKNSK